MARSPARGCTGPGIAQPLPAVPAHDPARRPEMAAGDVAPRDKCVRPGPGAPRVRHRSPAGFNQGRRIAAVETEGRVETPVAQPAWVSNRTHLPGCQDIA